MIYKTLFLIAVVTACAIGPSSSSATDKTSEYGPIERIIYTRENLEAAVTAWPKRDGAGAYGLSDYFCDFVISKPDLFLQVMSKNETVFSTWLEELQGISFFDMGGCHNAGYLECRRKLMISSLSLYSNSQQPNQQKQRLLAKLQAIRVTTA